MTELSSQRYRLPDGGDIDRERELRFTFNGRAYSGYEGDTLASALLANGVRIVGRSFKYHRPRGVFTAGEEEPCALVEAGEGDRRIPSCRAPMVPLTEGLVATSQSGWPSVKFDLGRILDFTHPLWPAGFYNKTFKWPSWEFWERFVRGMTGLGRPLKGPDPDRYEQVNVHCDLLVCGGGPSGLICALTAGKAGLRVILADQSNRLGGSLNAENLVLDGQPASAWINSTLSDLEALPNVTVLSRTTVAGIYDHRVTSLVQIGEGSSWRECLWTVRPRHIVLATGSIEQGQIFPGNDRPGIMLAGAARAYVNRFAVRPGQRVLVSTNNDSGYQTAFDLAARGIDVSGVIDPRIELDDSIRQRLQASGIRSWLSSRISATYGGRGISGVRIESMDGRHQTRTRCDLLAVSGGWSPRLHLLAHARGTLKFDERSQSFLPDRVPEGMSVVGSATGAVGLEHCQTEAVETTLKICRRLGNSADAPLLPRVDREPISSSSVAPLEIDASRSRQWIDLAHDVTYGDAVLAVEEGYVSVEHFKRYTTTGMSVDQGKTGNLNAFVVLGALTGRETGEVGTTTFRPPYTPVTLGAIAGPEIGDFYAPCRYLPAHTSHQSLDARFEDYGWLRPDYYPMPKEPAGKAIEREVLNVRNRVGVFDNSPIGKLEVRGPDAAELLNRVYINNVHNLLTGRSRYGLMLNENGVIIDDGVFTRFASDHFLVNTTSAGVERIHAMLDEWLQCEWRDLSVAVTDVTGQWANFTLAGPRARNVLLAIESDLDFSAAALPHMAAVSGKIAGLPARIFRISFSGELSYEINVPASGAASFLELLLRLGENFGIVPYGVEALMMLRLEKGYLHVGSDTDGSSTPDDVGWGQVARNKAADFIGKRSLFRPANLDPNRKQLVGLAPVDDHREVRPGGHLLGGENAGPPAETEGWITSAGFSPTLKRPIALGVLRAGRSRQGEVVSVIDGDSRYRARVVETSFYDPDNTRLRE